jgi:hypothetical protein
VAKFELAQISSLKAGVIKPGTPTESQQHEKLVWRKKRYKSP